MFLTKLISTHISQWLFKHQHLVHLLFSIFRLGTENYSKVNLILFVGSHELVIQSFAEVFFAEAERRLIELLQGMKFHIFWIQQNFSHLLTDITRFVVFLKSGDMPTSNIKFDTNPIVSILIAASCQRHDDSFHSLPAITGQSPNSLNSSLIGLRPADSIVSIESNDQAQLLILCVKKEIRSEIASLFGQFVTCIHAVRVICFDIPNWIRVIFRLWRFEHFIQLL